MLAGHLDTVPAERQRGPAPRRRHALRARRGRHEGRARRAAHTRRGAARRPGAGPASTRRSSSTRPRRSPSSSTGCAGCSPSAPDLVAGDLAVLLEPTGGWVEAGCQGDAAPPGHASGVTRAHSARPWMGTERDPPGLGRAGPARGPRGGRRRRGRARRTESRSRSCGSRAGSRNNVVPDECSIVVNRRFAPAYSVDEARAQVEALLDGADEIEVVNASPAARAEPLGPAGGRAHRHASISAVRPKLGWTDVARFAAHGVPGAELRSRRSRDRAHGGGARDPRVARRLLRGPRSLPGRGLRLRRAALQLAEDGHDLAVDRDLRGVEHHVLEHLVRRAAG